MGQLGRGLYVCQVPLCSLLSYILVKVTYLLNLLKLKRILQHVSLSVLVASSLVIGTVSGEDSTAAKAPGNSVQVLADVPDAFREEYSLWMSAEESGYSHHYQNYLERFSD